MDVICRVFYSLAQNPTLMLKFLHGDLVCEVSIPDLLPHMKGMWRCCVDMSVLNACHKKKRLHVFIATTKKKNGTQAELIKICKMYREVKIPYLNICS